MKRYRLIATAIIAVGILLIGTSASLNNFYKSTNLIHKGLDNKNDRKDSDDNKNKNSEIKPSLENNQKYLICIDPGHQQKGDPNLEPIGPGSGAKKARVSSGATGVSTKKPEYVLNLEASLVLKHILESKGFKVIMTRETHEVNISNAERARLANEKNADMAIRVHADSLSNSSKTGASILIPQKDGKYTATIFDKSDKCAQLVKKSMQSAGISLNGIFQRSDLTGFNWSKVPVVLVEMGFLSNHNEDQMMSNPEYQRKMMQSVADGIEEYFTTQ